MILTILIVVGNSFTLNTKFLEKIKNDQAQSAGRALIDIIRKFYIANDIKFEFIIYGKTTNHINDVINQITKELNMEIVINIRQIIDFVEWGHEMDQSAIFFVKSKSGLYSLRLLGSQHFSESLKHNTIKPLKFFVYAEYIKKLHRLKVELNEHPLFEVKKVNGIRAFTFYVIREKNEIILISQVFYSQTLCHKFSLEVLNRFDTETQKWNTTLKNYNHYENFHGCLLSFLIIAHDFSWYIDNIYKKNFNITKFLIKLYEGNFEAHGLTHEILKLASVKYNFTLHYIALLENIKFRHSNFVSFFPQKRYSVHQEDIAVTFKNDLIYDGNDTYGLYSEPCGTYENYFLVSLNDKLTNYEKLLKPFDDTTWILLAITFSLTFITIFASQFLQKWQKTLLYGEGINNPAYNALGIIFGISQLRLPLESGNRMMLALFIGFCLIFRTCYQSMLFEFMTSDMRKPLPASIEDLIKYNYAIVYIKQEEAYYKKVLEDIINGRNLKPINESLNYDYFYSLYNESLQDTLKQKYAFLVNHMKHAYMNQTFQNSLNIMENERISKTYGYTVSNDKRFMNSFNDVIHWLIPAGIPQQLADYALWFLQRPCDVVISDPRRILTLTDLEFGFVIWLASLSLPITCFLIEISIAIYRKVKRLIEELEVFVITRIVEITLEIFMSNYHGRW
ncbi:hypothetical protein PVAND_016229 [Polypedilum vanderplanki]|uniref:Ionotropic receptor n=1 Tax=Polypedilum vanderplanki TaxID=319348 RepID=A0A9J6BEZ2_POLVA|nr:hypothetical protein PVAND_016229 [Polypedilum vanderplanki]